MIVKLSRLLMLLLVILVASVSLPHYYRLSFGDRVVNPLIYYSPIIDDFLIFKNVKSKFRWKDTQGTKYSRKEVDVLLPLVNYRILLTNGQMPDSVRGVKINIDTVRLNNLFMKLRPKGIDAPGIKMFPLFESKPLRLKLFMPSNYMCITQKMEFIEAETNTINTSLTENFTSALQEQGFTFPAVKYFGNPSTRKAFDEGYFVVDADGKFFHIKKIRGEPYCRNISLPGGFAVRHMIVYENFLKEFYGIVINEKNEIFLLLYEGYKLQKLPIENYNAPEDQLIFRGDLFYRQVTIIKKRQIFSFVMDRSYKSLAHYEQKIPAKYSEFAGTMYNYLFPFTLSFSTSTSFFVDFYFSAYSLVALYFNFILMLILFSFKRYRSKTAIKKWYDFAIVLIVGIYGLIAVVIYENTDL